MPKSRKKLTGKTVKNKNMPRVKKSRARKKSRNARCPPGCHNQKCVDMYMMIDNPWMLKKNLKSKASRKPRKTSRKARSVKRKSSKRKASRKKRVKRKASRKKRVKRKASRKKRVKRKASRKKRVKRKASRKPRKLKNKSLKIKEKLKFRMFDVPHWGENCGICMEPIRWYQQGVGCLAAKKEGFSCCYKTKKGKIPTTCLGAHFHQGCMDQWLEHGDTCPMCRRSKKPQKKPVKSKRKRAALLGGALLAGGLLGRRYIPSPYYPHQGYLGDGMEVCVNPNDKSKAYYDKDGVLHTDFPYCSSDASRAQGIGGEFFYEQPEYPNLDPEEWRRETILKPVDDGEGIDDLVKAMVYPQKKGYWDKVK